MVVDVYEDDRGGVVYAEAEDLGDMSWVIKILMEMGKGARSPYGWHLGVPIHVRFIVVDYILTCEAFLRTV